MLRKRKCCFSQPVKAAKSDKKIIDKRWNEVEQHLNVVDYSIYEPHPGVHEDEVHLHEGEHELGDGVDSAEDHVARRVQRNLQEYAEFESVVNHCAEAKRCEVRKVDVRVMLEETEANREISPRCLG